MARTDEENTAMSNARYDAELVILTTISGGKVNAAAIRDLAEAHALLTGKLTAGNV